MPAINSLNDRKLSFGQKLRDKPLSSTGGNIWYYTTAKRLNEEVDS